MSKLATRARAWFNTRLGRLVLHDSALAAAAAAAVLEGAHSIDAGVLKAAGLVGLKVLLRLLIPVPAAEPDQPQLAQIGQVAVGIVSELAVQGVRLGRHIEHDIRSRGFRINPNVPIRSVQWHRHGPPLDQGNVGSCTGNAMAGLLMTDPFHKPRRTLREKQALELYSKATTLDSIPGAYPPTDTGSSGLAVAKAAKALGYITGYNHAFGLKEALAALMGGPAIFGTVWLTGMDTPDYRGIVQAVGTERGGHEYEGLGVDAVQKLCWFENSWGSSYGQQGRFAISFADVDRLLRQHGDVVQPALPA